jgi:hypothetical protein
MLYKSSIFPVENFIILQLLFTRSVRYMHVKSSSFQEFFKCSDFTVSLFALCFVHSADLSLQLTNTNNSK